MCTPSRTCSPASTPSLLSLSSNVNPPHLKAIYFFHGPVLLLAISLLEAGRTKASKLNT